MAFLGKLGYRGPATIAVGEASALIELALGASMDVALVQAPERYRVETRDASGHVVDWSEYRSRREAVAETEQWLEAGQSYQLFVPGPASRWVREDELPPPPAPAPRARVTEPGMYRIGEGGARRIFKVQQARESGNLYAKELVRQPGPTVR